MVMYINEFETKENKIKTKDKIEPQHTHYISISRLHLSYILSHLRVHSMP